MKAYNILTKWDLIYIYLIVSLLDYHQCCSLKKQRAYTIDRDNTHTLYFEKNRVYEISLKIQNVNNVYHGIPSTTLLITIWHGSLG